MPTPTPSPSAYLTVAVETPTLQAPYGRTTFACALQVTTTDPSPSLPYGTLIAYANNLPSKFPTYHYPTTSALTWSVPDLSSAATALYNEGMPGQTVWTSRTPHEVQQHCVDLTVDVPEGLERGTYPATITYAVTIGQATGLHAVAQTQSVTLDVVVTGG